MDTPTSPDAKRETDVRWDEAREFLRRVIRHRLARPDPDRVEDLTQEALIRLLRALRHEPARNLEGLMTEIARRTVIDSIRSRQRWDRLVRPLDEEIDDLPGASADALAEEFGDPLDRTRFVVLEYFRVRSPGCHELALLYFDQESWQAVSARIGKGYQAVRKQWSRCIESLREAARIGGGLLLEPS